MAFFSHVYRSEFWKPDDKCFFNSNLYYTYLQYKRKKFHGLFGLGWKKQGHTVTGFRAAGVFLTNYLKDKLA